MTILVVTLTCVAFIFGMITGIMIRPAKPTINDRYKCACTHSWGSHDETGCGAEVSRPRPGNKTGNEYVACACLRYAGEVPPQAYGLNVDFPTE